MMRKLKSIFIKQLMWENINIDVDKLYYKESGKTK